MISPSFFNQPPPLQMSVCSSFSSEYSEYSFIDSQPDCRKKMSPKSNRQSSEGISRAAEPKQISGRRSKSASAAPADPPAASEGKGVKGPEDASAPLGPGSPTSHVLVGPVPSPSSSPRSRKRNVSPDSPSKRAKISGSGEPETEGGLGKALPATPQKGEESPEPENYPSPPEVQATSHDKRTWQGWCEIESDPVSQFTVPLFITNQMI